MTRQETAKLLSLIKLSYPTAYRNIDGDAATAIVNMWQMTFRDLPYPIAEQAYDHYRMYNKYPPTIANMVDEIRHIYYTAQECAAAQRLLGNMDLQRQYTLVMDYTRQFLDSDIGCINISDLARRIGDGHSTDGNQMMGTIEHYKSPQIAKNTFGGK